MRLPARLVTFLVVVAALAAFGGGAVTGMALGERASRPGHSELVLADPALAGAVVERALRSPGGFTGFDGAGSLDGAAARSGTVGATRDGAFEVASEGSTLSLRSTSPARLFRIASLAGTLRTGDPVVVRVQTDGTATGILKVPSDLADGARRPTATPSGTPSPTATSTPAR